MKTILLLGNSLWFAGLEAGLAANDDYQIVNASLHASDKFPGSTYVDLIVVDQLQSVNWLELLTTFPATTVLHVDIAHGKLTTLIGATQAVTSVQDIVQLICMYCSSNG